MSNQFHHSFCSNEQFKFIIELGKRIKYLVPVDPKFIVEAENVIVEYQYRLDKMKETIENTDIDNNEKRP